MTRTTKTLSLTLASLLFLPAVTRAAEAAKGGPAAEARADIQKTLGFVPQFFLKFPETALPGAWEEMKTLQLNPATALPGRSKELIGLAVAAQIPCHYCIYAHTEFAKLNGASEEEIGEAVAMAATTRHWSTFINGIQTDEGKFRGEIAKLLLSLRGAGMTQLLVEHDVDLITSVCDHLWVMNLGTVIAEGKPREVISRPEVEEAYLGKAQR